MPITPTMARIKADPAAAPSLSSACSLISPDLQRVKVEIGQGRPHGHAQSMMQVGRQAGRGLKFT